jgi:hypothetical protein
MGIREKLVNNPSASKAVAAGLIVICGLVIFLEVKAGRPPAAAAIVGKTFYSDDDGKTWFLDDASRIPPFDHNGSPAYRAVVFRGKTGPPFVAYLARYSVKQTARMAQDAAQNPGAPSRMQMIPPQELKKPGESKWVTFTTPTTTGYPVVNCPDGSGPAMLVFPTDPESGATN